MYGVEKFDREVQNNWEVAQYGIPMVEYRAKVVPTIPLSYVLDVEVDDKKIVRITYFYITEDEEIDHFLEWAAGQKVLGYDLETSGLNSRDDKVATIQFGNPKAPDPRAYVIDVRAVSREALEPVFDLLRDKKLLKLGQNIKFECKFSQAQFGVKIRHVWDTQVAEMLIRAGLFTAKNKSGYMRKGEDRAAYKHSSMAALSSRFLGIDIDKDVELRTSFFRTPIGEHSMRQIVYAAGDVIYPFYIASYQRELIEQRKLGGVAKIEMGLIPVLADAEFTGLRIDVKKWRKLWQEAVKKRSEAECALDQIMLSQQPDFFAGTDPNVRPIYTGSKRPQPLNYSSAAQVKWALKQFCKATNFPRKLITTEKELLEEKAVWGQTWITKQSKNKVVTVKDVPDWVLPEDRYTVLLRTDKIRLLLAKCRGQLPANLVDLLVEYSKYDIRCDTFGNEFLNKHVRKDTGCIHTEFHQVVTTTGRLSSSPNLQNIPSGKEYRSCFIPKDGYVFVICDYSQIEPRITAQVSGDPIYIKTFLDDDDLYLAVAEAMLGYRPDKNTPEGKLERKIFKTVVLALAYNMGKWKLRDRLTLALHDEIMAGKVPAPTYDYASDLWDKFFAVHVRVRENQNRCIEEASPMVKKVLPEGYMPELVPNPRRIWDDFIQGDVTWVTSPCGRKRFFPPDAKNCYTEAPNVEPQSGSATITKAASWMLQQVIDENAWDAHIVNLVHDEIVCEVRKDIAADFALLMKELMEKAGQHYCPDIPIKAEYPEGSTGVVSYWAKEVTEEEEAEMEADLEDAA